MNRLNLWSNARLHELDDMEHAVDCKDGQRHAHLDGSRILQERGNNPHRSGVGKGCHRWHGLTDVKGYPPWTGIPSHGDGNARPRMCRHNFDAPAKRLRPRPRGTLNQGQNTGTPRDRPVPSFRTDTWPFVGCHGAARCRGSHQCRRHPSKGVGHQVFREAQGKSTPTSTLEIIAVWPSTSDTFMASALSSGLCFFRDSSAS
jgi:hypothetical protein